MGMGVEAEEKQTNLQVSKLFQTPPAPPTPLARFVRCRPRAAGSMNEGDGGERNEGLN